MPVDEHTPPVSSGFPISKKNHENVTSRGQAAAPHRGSGHDGPSSALFAVDTGWVAK
jgi:hypothetical protein